MLSTFLLQEKKHFFLSFKVYRYVCARYRYVCARHGTATQLRLILKRPLIIDGLISSKNVPLRQGKYIEFILRNSMLSPNIAH